MSASLWLRPCAATFTAPACCGDAPHCDQKGEFDAGGGGGGGGGFEWVEELPHAERTIKIATVTHTDAVGPARCQLLEQVRGCRGSARGAEGLRLRSAGASLRSGSQVELRSRFLIVISTHRIVRARTPEAWRN